jgi:drug/metabolite transporter (DMT)-like permease
MPKWILVVAIAQFLYAVASIVDKFILTSKKVSKPFVYAFYVTILSVIPIGLFFLSPFRITIGTYTLPLFENITRPTASLMAMALISAFAGFYALLSLYSALKKSDASDVVPVIGSISAIGTFMLGFLFAYEPLSQNFLYGFILLVLGTAFVSHFRFTKEVVLLTLHSGFLYSIKVLMMKEMFNEAGFDQAFFWSRVAILIVLISLILIPSTKEKIQFYGAKTNKKGNLWVLGNAILGGIAAFILLKANEMARTEEISLIQAMDGLKFLYLGGLSILFGRISNKHLGENNTTRRDLFQKTISTILLVAGFTFLFL